MIVQSSIKARIGNTTGVADIHYELGPQSNTGDWALSKGDWRIINALNHRARTEAVDIAKKVGLSSKTIRSRINQLVKQRAVKFGVDVNLSKAKDLFIYMLVVRLKQGVPKDQTTTQVRRSVPTIWREIRSINPFEVIFSLFAERLADLERDVESVRLVPGVAGINVAFVTAEHMNPKWFDNLLSSKAA